MSQSIIEAHKFDIILNITHITENHRTVQVGVIRKNAVFFSMFILTVSIFTLMVCHDAHARVNPDTLESIANQTDELDVAHIDVEGKPTEITALTPIINPNDDLYVISHEPDIVTVINPTTNTVKETIPVGQQPNDIYSYESSSYLVQPDDAVYVTNAGSDNVTVIDPKTNTVKKTLSVGENPGDIEGYKSNRRGINAIYVANFESGTVSVLDPTTNTVNQTISVGPSPMSIAAGGGYVYVARGTTGGPVSVIDPTTNTVIKNITGVVGFPRLAYYSGLFHELYVGSDPGDYPDSGTISVIDPKTKTVIKNITVGTRAPNDIYEYYSLSTESGAIYVANDANDGSGSLRY